MGDDRHPGYCSSDRERWVEESPKGRQRGEFARDRARVLHSSALRRLGAKTQVVGPQSDDFVRNRLTHSLEVAQVGRELGLALGCDPDVVDTACLAHDLGHPPFGHNGEVALDAVAAHIGGFEGNAQTLRVLTRLEPKVLDPATGCGVGLNLTRASLDAVAKYPWPRPAGVPGAASGKFGVYADDRPVFDWVRRDVPGERRCVEAQVMDLADDIAYSVHDVEDAVVASHLDLEVLSSPDERRRVAVQVRSWYLPDAGDDEVLEAFVRLRGLPEWVRGFDGSVRALAALKNLTSHLIGRFTRAIEEATRDRYGPGPLTRHGGDVVIPRETLVEVNVLKGIAAVYVMTLADRQPLYERQRAVLTGLFSALALHAPETLEAAYAGVWSQATDDDARLRVVVDQVASLTDGRAVAWHRRLALD